MSDKSKKNKATPDDYNTSDDDFIDDGDVSGEDTDVSYEEEEDSSSDEEELMVMVDDDNLEDDADTPAVEEGGDPLEPESGNGNASTSDKKRRMENEVKELLCSIPESELVESTHEFVDGVRRSKRRRTATVTYQNEHWGSAEKGLLLKDVTTAEFEEYMNNEDDPEICSGDDSDEEEDSDDDDVVENTEMGPPVAVPAVPESEVPSGIDEETSK